MPMDPQMGQDPGQPDPGQPGQSNGGGAAKLVADTHTNLMKLMDLLGNQFPDEAKQLSGIVSSFQQFVEGLGQPADAQSEEQGPAMPGTTTPQAGAAKVQQAM